MFVTYQTYHGCLVPKILQQRLNDEREHRSSDPGTGIHDTVGQSSFPLKPLKEKYGCWIIEDWVDFGRLPSAKYR